MEMHESAWRRKEPLAGTLIALEANAALTLAASRRDGRPLDTFGLMLALIHVDSHSGWETIQLRASFVGPETWRADDDGEPAGAWEGVPLTAATVTALESARGIAERYRLIPLPAAVLALGCLWDSRSGAARGLLEDAAITHTEVLELIQLELLDTRLEGLQVSDEPSPKPAADRTPPPAVGPFAGAAIPDQPRWTLTLLDEPPPVEGALRARIEGAAIVRGRTQPAQAWLYDVGDAVLKIYDLDLQSDPDGVRAMVEYQSSLAELAGFVAPLRVTEQGPFLIVELPRCGPSLADHLRATAAGRTSRLPSESYAAAVARVADALNTLHERALGHHAICLEHVLIDPRTGWLTLIGARATPGASADRYLAPELHQGEVGAGVDQFALGVTTRDVFASRDAPPLTAPVSHVLGRATAARPGDRFATVAEFGGALRQATATEAPRSLGDRLAKLQRRQRLGHEAGLIGALAAVPALVADEFHSLDEAPIAMLETILFLVVTYAIGYGVVAIGSGIRGILRRPSIASSRAGTSHRSRSWRCSRCCSRPGR